VNLTFPPWWAILDGRRKPGPYIA